jgi:hypothetical protein
VIGAAPASSLEVEIREENPASLAELLNETRILLPGTEIFLAFLMTLPFTSRFESLDDGQRVVYLATFFAALAAFACFVAPAAYHRIARPIRDKARFKMFANSLLVIGLAPASVAFVLVTYLVSSVVAPTVAVPAASVMAGLIVVLWWAIPLARLHDKFPKPKNVAGHAAE